LTSVLPDPHATKRPGLWYPQGAGGMWLNYLIWCSQANKIVPGDHYYFEWPYIQSLEPKYISFLGFYPHNRDYSTAPIRLGSDRAWFNFFLNINAKKGMPAEYSALVQGSTNFLIWHQQNIDFTLDWCLIFKDPEQFIAQLNAITDFDVSLNSVTEQAIEQYRKSCVWVQDYNDFRVKAWRQAALNLFTDRKQSLPQRLQIAEEVFYNTYYKI